ncbi:MAG: hypothetical protein R2911_24640 [Caldilineaceae bacterium]
MKRSLNLPPPKPPNRCGRRLSPAWTKAKSTLLPADVGDLSWKAPVSMLRPAGRSMWPRTHGAWWRPAA